MTLDDFFDKAHAIAAEFKVDPMGISVGAKKYKYTHLAKPEYCYCCTVWHPTCETTGDHNAPEKALAKLRLILENANIKNLPSDGEVSQVEAKPIPIGYKIDGEDVITIPDGDQIMAHLAGFENVAESEAGFGNTIEEAVANLAKQLGKKAIPVYQGSADGYVTAVTLVSNPQVPFVATTTNEESEVENA